MTTGNKICLTLAGLSLAGAAALRYQQGAQTQEIINRYYLQSPAIESTLPINSPVPSPSSDPKQAPIGQSMIDPYAQFAVIKGGVSNVDDFCEQIQGNSAFEGFNCLNAKEIRLAHDLHVYMTFKKSGRIVWTKRPVLVREGELVFTDGLQSYLARCGNQIRFSPMEPSMEIEAAELTPMIPVTPMIPPVRESVPAPAAIVTLESSPSRVANSSGSDRSWWGGLAAVPVLIWKGGSHSNNDSVIVIAPKPSCDPIEFGNCNQ